MMWMPISNLGFEVNSYYKSLQFGEPGSFLGEVFRRLGPCLQLLSLFGLQLWIELILLEDGVSLL
jgi:hypothetical protein